LAVERADSLYWSTPSQSLTDVYLEVDALPGGRSGESYFGLVCRVDANERFYYLVITANGEYTIGKFQDGEFISLLPDGWPVSPVIARGRTTNRLAAECRGDRLRLWVNGELLAEAHDGDIPSGEYGVALAGLDADGAVASFDNFTARAP
jgi:hypothetical protein